ncbi:MAG: septum formation initiator family protein [bacterium]
MSKPDQTTEGYYKKSQKKATRLWLLLAFVFLVIITLFSIFGENGLLKVNQLKKNCTQIRQEVDNLTEENKRLFQEIYALKKDSSYIESLARSKLGLVKPNEIVYQFLPNSKEGDNK